DLDITWDFTGIATIGRNTEGITWCNDEWKNYNDVQEIGLSMPSSVRAYKDIRVDGFWIYTKEILNRIVINAGFTMDDSLVSWDRWDKVAIACPAHKWVEIEAKVGSYSGSIGKQNNSTDTDTDTIIIIPFDGSVIDPDNQWSIANDQWTIDTGTDPTRTIVFTATLNLIHTQKNPNGVPYVAIRLNGINVETHNFLNDETDVITLEAELIVSTGDLIDCVNFMPNGTGINGSSVTVLASGTTFVMNEIAGVDPDDTLEVDKYIPEMAASKFVTSICNMANVIIYVTEATRTVRFISFDELINSEQQDWSEKLVLNKSIQATNIISSYFQNNEFKYAMNGPIARSDTTGEYIFRDELLDIRGTLIQLDFDACDDAIYNSLACTAGFYGVTRKSATGISLTSGLSTFFTTNVEEWNIGDYIEVNTIGATFETLRIIGKVTDTQGIVSGTWNNTKTDSTLQYHFHRHTHGDFDIVRVGFINPDEISTNAVDGVFNVSPTAIDSYRAEFDSEMTFQFLVDTQYNSLLNVLDPPAVMVAWFNFSTSEFVNIELNKLVYINYFNSVFYINKIDQYKAGQPVRIELVRAISL
ncbi:hypothetical protein KAR91_54055, partial [Candidatus Pacearchaeota archaeon]|nr:hypothetical protein [Candidatus Pacearchaeota archaeon]